MRTSLTSFPGRKTCSGLAAIALVIAVAPAVLTACATTTQPSGPSVAEAGKQRVRLRWRTETEFNAFGFYVYRADSPEAEAVCLNGDDPLHACGTTDAPQEYVFYDLDVTAGQACFYKLEQVDLDGSRKWLVGHPAPLSGAPKPLTEAEAKEIRLRGHMYREEAGR